MKPISHNTSTYIWSNVKRCRICGFSNTFFVRKWYTYKNEKKFTIGNICRECFVELKKPAEKKFRESQKRKEWRREYIARNIERIKEQNRIANRKLYHKKKIRKLQDKMIREYG